MQFARKKIKYTTVNKWHFSTKFDILVYNTNFRKEDYLLNNYEVIYTSVITVWVKGEKQVIKDTRVVKVVTESDYYKDYLIFLEEGRNIDTLENINTFSTKNWGATYYSYYVWFDVVDFAVRTTLTKIYASAVKYPNFKSFHLNGKTWDIFFYSLIFCFFDCLVVDNFSVNRLSRNAFIEDVSSLIKDNFDRSWVIGDCPEYFDEEEETFTEDALKMCDILATKIVTMVLLILEDLGIILHLRKHSSSFKNKNNPVADSNRVNQDGKLAKPGHNLTHNISEVSNLKIENKLDILQNIRDEDLLKRGIDRDFVIKEEKRKVIEKFQQTGSHFFLFSNQILFQRDILSNIFLTPPVVHKHKLVFDNNKTFDLFSYNLSNGKFSTKSVIRINYLVHHLSNGIIFSYELFNIIHPFLAGFYKNVKLSTDIHKYHSIATALTSLFTELKDIRVYLAFVFDFRGRIYMPGPLSITSTKLLRCIIGVSKHKQTNIEKNKYYSDLLKWKHLLKDFDENYKKWDETKQFIVLYTLLNTGRILKGSILKKNKTFKVHISEFILLGITLHKVEENKLILDYKLTDLNDYISVLTLRFKLNSYLNYNLFFTVIVDSTCSGLFQLNIWCNIRTQYLEYFNLQENEWWVDPYSFILWLSKEKLGDKYPHKYDYLLTRSAIKPVLMVIPYNGTLYTQGNYLMTNFNEAERAASKFWVSDFLKNLKIILTDVYEKDFTELYKDPRFKGDYIVYLNNNIYDLNYYVTESIETKKVQICKVRKKMYSLVTKYPLELKIDKTTIAFTANLIHITDAAFLHCVIRSCIDAKIDVATIHDEIIADIRCIPKILSIANDQYTKLYLEINPTRNNPNYYNFFILI